MDCHIDFNLNISKNKPNTILSINNSCPFCSYERLKEESIVLGLKDNILWIENKYMTFSNSYQTVIVENNNCNYDLSNYPKNMLYDIISFVIDAWFKMMKDKQYKSVTLIKNQGLLSGASIHHPHMQIVGFEKIDYQDNISDKDFEGLEIFKDKDIEYNLSTSPRSEFYEFNVILHSQIEIRKLADVIQNTVHFILNYLNKNNQSYNLVFYHYKGKIIAKIIPRFPVSAYLLGYNFKQIPNNLNEIVQKIINLYY